MDFNSNDEYLKVFPPNFGLKLEGHNMLNQLKVSDYQVQKVLPEDQVVEKTPVMEVQRDNEMVLGESDGAPSVETALSLQATETRVFDGETLILSDTQVEGPPSAIEIVQETTIHCEIPAEDVITVGVIKDAILALDNIGDNEAEKSVAEESIEVATMKDETFGLPPLREFVEGTQIFVEQERLITDIDTAEGNTMDTDQPWQDVQNGQQAGGTTLGQIEFVEETMTTTTLIETSENTDAIDSIESKEPVTLEMIKSTTVTATYETQTSPNELTEHTQIESEVLGTENAFEEVEITEKTTVKAKAVCPYEWEEPPCERNGVPSASNSTTGLEDLRGTCSDADVDKIVDSIMNDIAADIEADMEVENEADMENNTQYQKLEICGKSVGMESTALCQDYIQSTGSHV